MKIYLTTVLFSTYFLLMISGNIYAGQAPSGMQDVIFSQRFFAAIEDTNLQKYLSAQIGLILSINENKLQEYLQQNRFIITLNDNLYGTPAFFSIAEIIPIVSDTSAAVEMKFNRNDNKPANNGYTVKWSSSYGIFVFAFPACPQILYDRDKTFFDSLFFSVLKSLEHSRGNIKNVSSEIINTADPESDTATGLYYKTETNLFGFSDRVYLEIKNGDTIIVNAKEHYRETIFNHIGFAQKLSNNISLDIEHKQYGGSAYANGIYLNDLINEMIISGHKVLTGIEDGKDSLLTTLIFYNSFYGYIHLLYFNFPFAEVMNHQHATAKARIYSYIRLDNVKNYFDEYEEKRGRFKVKVK